MMCQVLRALMGYCIESLNHSYGKHTFLSILHSTEKGTRGQLARDDVSNQVHARLELVLSREAKR